MSEFVEVKTAELVGAALDWATFCAIFKGLQPKIKITESITRQLPGFPNGRPVTIPRSVSLSYQGAYGVEYFWLPSGDWECTGPLIARFLIEFTVEHKTLIFACLSDENGMPIISGEVYGSFGPTHLVAACRAIVLTKIGPVASVPRELIP